MVGCGSGGARGAQGAWGPGGGLNWSRPPTPGVGGLTLRAFKRYNCTLKCSPGHTNYPFWDIFFSLDPLLLGLYEILKELLRNYFV